MKVKAQLHHDGPVHVTQAVEYREGLHSNNTGQVVLAKPAQVQQTPCKDGHLRHVSADVRAEPKHMPQQHDMTVHSAGLQQQDKCMNGEGVKYLTERMQPMARTGYFFHLRNGRSTEYAMPSKRLPTRVANKGAEPM